MRLFQNAKRVVVTHSKAALAVLVMAIMVVSSMPLEALAQVISGTPTTSATITTVTVDGQEAIIGDNGSFQIPETNVTINETIVGTGGGGAEDAIRAATMAISDQHRTWDTFP